MDGGADRGDCGRVAARVCAGRVRHRVRRTGELRRAAGGALDSRGRLARFRLVRLREGSGRRAGDHGQRCQRGRHGRGRVRRRPGLFAAVLYDALHGNRRGHLGGRPHLARRRFLRGRDRAPHDTPRWPGVPVRRPRMSGANVLRPVAGARSRQERAGIDAGRRSS